MKKLFFFSIVCIATFLLSCNQTSQVNLSTIDPGQYDTTWYNHAPLRFIQTNLSEIDAKMNVDTYYQLLQWAQQTGVIAVVLSQSGQ